MFSRILGSAFIVWILYLLLVFISPNTADQYWNKEINAKIREIKNQSLLFASWADSPQSLFEKIKGESVKYVDQTKATIDTLNTTVDTKVKQVQDASIAVENAYSGVMDATQKIKNLTGTGK